MFTYNKWILIGASSATVFVADVLMPLGYAGGLPYIGVLFLAYHLKVRNASTYLALGTIMLTLIGAYCSSGAITWIIALNRILAISGIGFAYVFVETLSNTNAKLKNITKELTSQKTAMDQHSIVSSTDVRGKMNYVNDKLCDVSGYSKEELIGQSHNILNSSEHSDEFFKDLWRTIANGHVWRGNVKNKKKSGETYWVKTTIVPFLNSTNKPYKYIGIRTDITEQIEYEEKLEIAKDAAELANLEKTNFLSSMSHDLRTPLNAILGFSELIQSQIFGPIGNDKYNEYIENIHGSGKQLLSLVNDILDISLLERGDYVPENGPMDTLGLLDEVIKSFQYITLEKNLEIKGILSPNGPKTIIGDKRIAMQILNNLLGNACRHTAHGGKISITWETSENAETILRVSDNGEGIPLEMLNELGQPFISSNAYVASNTGRGTGLGLYICRKFIEERNGYMTIESKVNAGTTVSAIWPEGTLTPKGQSDKADVSEKQMSLVH